MGRQFFGESLQAEKGRDLPLLYDQNCAYESEENNKIILRSSRSGALKLKSGILTIVDHMTIDGDVGLETGNIQFNGSVSINGTVLPGYSVVASGDIEVNSKEGVRNPKLIQSTNSSIYIRGGVFGRGETVIEAGKDIYIKHANDCNLSAKDLVHIGFYSIGSNIIAKIIIVDERKGKIIGGKAEALLQIATAISGNRLDRRTELIVKGINKEQLLADVQVNALELKDLQKNIEQLRGKIEQLQKFESEMTYEQKEVFEKTKLLYETNIQQFKDIDLEIQAALELMKNEISEEIRITKEANSNTLIQIGPLSKVLSKTTVGTFKVEDGALNV